MIKPPDHEQSATPSPDLENTDASGQDPEFAACIERMNKDMATWERRIRRSRRVSLLFLPLYIVGGTLIGTALPKVQDQSLQIMLGIGLIAILLGQWGQPGWLYYLNRRAGDHPPPTVERRLTK
jgi:hypothetical protein